MPKKLKKAGDRGIGVLSRLPPSFIEGPQLLLDIAINLGKALDFPLVPCVGSRTLTDAFIFGQRWWRR
jgi:hypothetical protein